MFGLVEPTHFVGEMVHCSFLSSQAHLQLYQIPAPRSPPSAGNVSTTRVALTFLPLTTLTCHRAGPLSERRLMDVRLGELPAWLATCNFSPQGLLGGVQKGETKFMALGAELSHLPDLLAAGWSKWPVWILIEK